MKLLYIANMRLPTEKAHGLQVTKMCEAFALLGHRVTLVVPWRFGRVEADPYEYYDVERNFRIVRVFSLDLIPHFGAVGFFIQVFTFAFSSFVYALFARPALIYGRDEVVLWGTTFLGLRTLWEVHTRKLNWFARSLLSRADTLVTISGGLRELLLKAGADDKKILVAHDGADPSKYAVPFDRDAWRLSKDIPLEAKVAAYVGAIHTMGEGKGVEEIIALFPEVLEREPDAFLLLTGMPEKDRAAVLALCEKAGVPLSNVRVDTDLRQREIIPYFRAADVHVMNFPFTEHYAYYMSPLKMFNYMASGVPMITTDLPSVREVLSEKEAVFIPPGDSDALLEALLRVLTGSEDVRERARAAEALFLTHYTWEERARVILDSPRSH
ncbi:glycosyltransferase [Candidatus Parcubacteria bacterium]|nr:glycosyltransferase [Candidatus Parcubacteria bacterium]